MRKHRYRIRLRPEAEGGFTVEFDSLQGCVSWGSDEAHAVEMAHEAAQGIVEVLAEFGDPIPDEDNISPNDLFVEVEVPANV